MKMVKDEDTAYDEVIRDIGEIGTKNIENDKQLILFMQKINQLMRIMQDEEIYEEPISATVRAFRIVNKRPR